MAEFSPVRMTGSADDRVQVFEWQDSGGDDTITVVSDTIASAGLFTGKYREVSVQCEQDTGGTYAIEWHGTLSPNVEGFVALTDARSSAVISQTADGIDEVAQLVYQLKPVLATSTSGIVKLRAMCVL